TIHRLLDELNELTEQLNHQSTDNSADIIFHLQSAKRLFSVTETENARTTPYTQPAKQASARRSFTIQKHLPPTAEHSLLNSGNRAGVEAPYQAPAIKIIRIV